MPAGAQSFELIARGRVRGLASALRIAVPRHDGSLSRGAQLFFSILHDIYLATHDRLNTSRAHRDGTRNQRSAKRGRIYFIFISEVATAVAPRLKAPANVIALSAR